MSRSYKQYVGGAKDIGSIQMVLDIADRVTQEIDFGAAVLKLLS